MWTIALILNVVHLAYHQVTTNFDFFPFNNVRNYKTSERIFEAGMNGLIMAFPIVALSLHNQKMIAASCWVLGFLLLGEFLSWWPHYFLGTPGWMHKWQAAYDRTHKHTIRILPPIKDHPVPNLEHCILHLITLAAFVATLCV
jgi:hypothetical protein